MNPSFDDSSWAHGKSGLGTPGMPGAIIGARWQADDIWLRREVNLSMKDYDQLQAWLHHNEDVEVYINGVLAITASDFIISYDVSSLTPDGRAVLKRGRNLIAIHSHQTVGAQYVNLGFTRV